MQSQHNKSQLVMKFSLMRTSEVVIFGRVALALLKEVIIPSGKESANMLILNLANFPICMY